MKKIRNIFLLILVAIILFSVYIARKDADYKTVFHDTIDAPKELVFQTVKNFNTWKNWSALIPQDTTTVIRFVDENHFSWKHPFSENGYAETIQTDKPTLLVLEITEKPFGTFRYTWQFDSTGEGNQTKITRIAEGHLNFKEKIKIMLLGGIRKVFNPIMTGDSANLSAYLSKIMNVHSIVPLGEVERGGGFFVYTGTKCSFDEIAEKMDALLPSVIFYCIGEKFPVSGAPFTLYQQYDEKNKVAEFYCCVPVSERVEPKGDCALAYLEKGRYFKTRLKGSYKYSGEAWKKAFAFAAEAGKTIDENKPPFEVYVAGHSKHPNPADWITDIYLPLK